MCCRCYSPVSQDYNAETCKQRRTCKICKQSHPTCLPGYLPKKKQSKVTSDSKDGVPPVEDKKLMTSNFAEMDIKCNSSMLNNCNQGTFIKEDIEKNLGAVSREADIAVKTLNGE